MAALDAEDDGEAVASRRFVAEDESQEVLMRHLLLAREDESLGQRVEHAPELQAPEDGFEIGTDHVGGHSTSPSERRARGSGNAYWVAGRRKRASGSTRAGAAGAVG